MKCLRSFLPGRTIALSLAALSAAAVTAHATPVITNGSFNTITAPYSAQLGTNNQSVTGWSSSGLNLVYVPGSTGAYTCCTATYGTLSLAGSPTVSPNGGDYIALDGDSNFSGAFSTTVTGLTKGDNESISFYFAGAQQSSFLNATTEQLQVSLGSQTLSTQVLNNPQGGFTGWNAVTLNFTATSATETLSFLSVGTPTGAPPFALLDGVSIAETPEPSSLVFLATGLAGAAGMVRRRLIKT